MTRRLAATLAACLLGLGLGAAPAAADNGPHVQGAGVLADSCAGCHRVHTAKSDTLTTKADQPALCFTCHGTTGTGAETDVEAGVSRGPGGGALRGGGFQYALIGSDKASGQRASSSNVDGRVPTLAAGAPVTSTHIVTGADEVAWGNGPIVDGGPATYGVTVKLNCTSCHDPHGNGNYRILRVNPFDHASTTGAAIADDPGTKTYTTANYWSVEDTDAPQFIKNVAGWCATCHTRYLAGTGAGDVASKDAVFKYRHTSNRDEQGGPNCIQCHVAHGSNAAYDLAVPMTATVPAGSVISTGIVHQDGDLGTIVGENGANTSTGSYLLRIDNRGTCQMCHGPKAPLQP